MTGPTPPFALFVIADGIDADVSTIPSSPLIPYVLTSAKYLSDALTQAYKGDFEAALE